MPDVTFGGTNSNSWFDYTNQLLYTNISVPARRVAANGQGPQLITHVSGFIAGYTTTVTFKLYAGGKKTGTLTRGADSTPSDTGLTSLTSNLYIANGTTVSFGASDNNDGLYFYRSTSGTTTISPNGYSWAGTLRGGYRYLESPTAPRTLTATPSATVTGQVDLSWLSPSDNGGSTVTSYNVYRLSGGTYTLLGSTSGTTYSATGLTAGTSYTFVIRARNAVTDTAGTQSVDSNTATATAPYIPPPVGAPGAPTGLSTTTSTSILGAVGLSWTAPSDTGGVGVTITGYDVYVNGVFFASTTGTGTTYTATGLAELSTSSFTVLARNSGGFSGPQSTAASGKASGVPTAPTGLTATPDTLISGKINLSWTAPADSGGGISGYRIYNATTNDLIADQSGTGTTYSQTGRTAGTEYFYYVRAYNAIGLAQDPDVYGAQSDTDSAVAENVSGAPAVTASTTVAGRLTITWTANVGATSYTIRNKTAGTSVVVSSNITTYVWDGLTAGTEYGFTKQPNGGDESEIGYGTPNGTSVQPLTTAKTVTNATNTALSTSSVAITSASSDTFTYSKTVSNLSEAQVSSSSAVVTNKTNQDLTDADGTVTDTIAASPAPTDKTFSYLRSGTALTETNVTGGTTLVNSTNVELNETGVSVVVPGVSTDTFTYETTKYTGSAIDIASGGTATNLSQEDFNVTQEPITAVTEYTLSYAKVEADQEASAATGTVVNETNKQVFNKNTGNDTVLSVPDYKTVKYAVVGGLHADIATTSQASTTVTVTTKAAHYFKAGNTVTIEGSTNGSNVFNGQWTIASVSTPAPVAISTTARSAYTVTVDTSASHGLKTGEYVVIAGSTNGSGVLNGTWVVASTPSTTQFTFTHTVTGTINSASDSLATVAPPSRFTFTRTTATIASAPDASAKADVDIPETTVANPVDSATRVTSSPDTKLEVIYRSGWIG